MSAVDIDAILESWLVPSRLAAPRLAADRSLEPEVFRRTLPPTPLPAFPPATGHPAYGAGVEIACRAWGEGPPVALVHGWGGAGAQWAAWIEPLLSLGLRVIAFDAPAHGESGGTQASALAFGGALRAVARREGAPLYGIIAHSLGALGAAFALADGLAADRAIFLAPCADVVPNLLSFGEERGAGPEDERALIGAFRCRFGPWVDIVAAMARMVEPPPLWLFHDRADAQVPYRDAETIAELWTGSRLVETPRVGHHRILIARGVQQQALAVLHRG